MQIEVGRQSKPSRESGSLITQHTLVPAWVDDLSTSRFHRVSATFHGTRGMDDLTFQQRVVDAYRTAFEQLDSTQFTYPVRFWAFIPGIHDDLGAGLDRYMSFNAGRYGAFAQHYGHPSSFGGSIPTASAVGIQGDQFVLHCLASDEPGRAVENPRQVSAYHYSRRFGPMPPCFARATLLQGHSHQPLLLVGGTASITGEESRHAGNIEAQAGETFRNLASVVAAATGYRVSENASRANVHDFLAAFRHLRVYVLEVRRPGDSSPVGTGELLERLPRRMAPGVAVPSRTPSRNRRRRRSTR